MARNSKHTTVLQEVSFSDELKELLPEYPFPFALRGIYDDVWGTTPVPGDPTEGKYPHRQYPPSLKKQAGTTYGLLSSLLAQRGNLRKLLKIRCGCGNEYEVFYVVHTLPATGSSYVITQYTQMLCVPRG